MDMRIKEEFRETTVIQKSEFIACAAPCRSEEEAREYISLIRAEFRDASHVCTAYVCGTSGEIRRSSDNGEPSGTAGIPMLEAVMHSGLQDICVCVVRYFGGIKLGAGGLIRAYGGAVTSCLAHAPKTRDVYFDRYRLTYPYEMTGNIDRWIRKKAYLVDTQYGEQVTVIFECAKDTDAVKEIQDISSGSLLPEYVEETVREVDL